MPAPSFNITVNNKPVPMDEHRTTGSGVKKAAIDAGLPIEPDFQLSEVRPNGELRVVGDDEPITVNKNSEFRVAAVADVAASFPECAVTSTADCEDQREAWRSCWASGR
jgi:hypothetical protein